MNVQDVYMFICNLFCDYAGIALKSVVSHCSVVLFVALPSIAKSEILSLPSSKSMLFIPV